METTVKEQKRPILSERTKEILVNVICYLFVLLFFYAAASKLLEYNKFKLQISKSPIITDYAHILVWLVPITEIIISILLLVNRTVLLGLYTAFGLMCLFTVYIYAILNFTSTTPCSCGGVLEKLGWTEHLIFNIVFVVLALIGILLQVKIMEKKTISVL